MAHRYGSGSLFQRGKKGIWYYTVWVNGKQIGPRSARTTNRAKAQQELDKALGKRARGEFPVGKQSEDLTVADLLQEYITYADEKLDNARGVKWVLEAHPLKHRIARLKPGALATDDLRRYRKDRKAEGAEDATCNREISYIRAALRRALKEGRVKSLPYFPVTNEDDRARKGFQEEDKFLRFLAELPLYLKGFACCAYYVGMRRGEILSLEPADVDLARMFMEVRRSKNDDPRIVPIFDGPMAQWVRWALEHCGHKLFVRPDGSPMTSRNFYADWHAAANRAGVHGFIPHDSRRSASRNMRNRRIPQSVRMKIIGHKTDSMDRRYGIVDLADVEFVREVMSRPPKKTSAKTSAIRKVQHA